MLGFGFLRERKAKAIVSNTLPTLPEGLQLLSPIDRAATLAIANAMLDVSADNWGATIRKGPSAIPKATVVEIVLSLAAKHAGIVTRSLEPNQDRNMGDIYYAQAMRELRACELLIGTLGSRLVDGAKPGVGQAWKLLWNARAHAQDAASSLVAFSKHARIDAVPRTRARPKPARPEDLLKMASTVPAFLVQRPPPAKPVRGAAPVSAKAPATVKAAPTGKARPPNGQRKDGGAR